MKLKLLWAIIPFFITLAFIGCDDDLNDIGSSIQPPSDSISVGTDTVFVRARTISMRDSVYARTINGVLGKYEEDLFGTIKSDYLAQFYFPDSAKFKKNLITIDSAQFVVDFLKFSGDSLAPMGLSVYEVNKKPLIENFYTNADPSEYCDLTEVLANQAYTIDGAKIVATSKAGTQRELIADLGIPFGKRIYDAYSSGEIRDNKSFNEFFKGVYVTTNFGSGSLINVLYTSMDIYYKYNDIKGNHDNTKDTIRTSTFSLSVTPEVIQLNHIKNTNPSELFVEGTGSTYMKTPAGVYTEVNFPIKEIRDNMAKKKLKTVNSAQFLVNGYTEKETNSKFTLERPTYFLLIDKDSVGDFFTKQKLPNGISSFYTARDTYYNTYNFRNISSLINHYNDKKVDDVKFLLIPVEVATEYTTGATIGVYNYLKPSTAILRSDPENMKLSLIYSKFDNE